MRISIGALLLTLLCASTAGYAAQAGAGQAQPAQAQISPAKAPPASAVLQPALDELQQTLGAIKIEKWKGGTVRSEAGTNIASIQRDLQGALPGLLAAADAAPGAMSKALLVSRNVDALYDVLLRVVDGARIAGPGDQVDQLQRAMADVEKARLAWTDHLQELAAAEEKQVGDLQGALQAQAHAAPMCPVAAPAASTPAPARKTVRKKRKPAAAPPPAKAQPNATTKPNS